MKLLENQRLAAITAYLTERAVSERILDGRVEAFSCKRAGDDKKLFKKLEAQYNDELATSPSSLTSQLGALSDAGTRRLLIDLIATLNASFPDYDFSSLRPEQFTREPNSGIVARAINRQLSDLTQTFLDQVWAAVEDAVGLADCDVYSYVPDLDSDPFSADGCLWSFNYFFVNKHLKRIVYFTCVARSKYSRYDESFDDDDDDDFRIRGDHPSSTGGGFFDDDDQLHGAHHHPDDAMDDDDDDIDD
mmetsp:Transcript_3236/g.8328  ORF Transcript_3236/g.8328 Transcript_3236/m.8328 type:complete len:247 (+) Transcript_3236:39-779(+)